MSRVNEYRKGITFAIAALGIIVNENVAHGTVQHWLTISIAVLGSALGTIIPNADSKKPATDDGPR